LAAISTQGGSGNQGGDKHAQAEGETEAKKEGCCPKTAAEKAGKYVPLRRRYSWKRPFRGRPFCHISYMLIF